MTKEIISTEQAPQAIGPYSQAVKVGSTVYLSGQIPLQPGSMTLVDGGIAAQSRQVFANLAAVAAAAGGSLQDAVKVNISLTNLEDFAEVNAIMTEVFQQPFPARACVQVVALPKAADIEIEAILELGQ